jgi:hypothetical protein
MGRRRQGNRSFTGVNTETWKSFLPALSEAGWFCKAFLWFFLLLDRRIIRWLLSFKEM